MNNSRPRVVFAGGGHASLYSLLMTREIVNEGIDVILIAPERFHYYSGMTPGIISNIYNSRDTRLDVRYLVEKGGGQYVQDRVIEIDHENQRVILQSGDSIRYDALATNLGSYVPPDQFGKETQDQVRDASNIYPVKPVINLTRLYERLRSYSDHDHPRILAVGGGASGVEMAANTKVYLNRRGIRSEVTLASARERLLPSFPAKAGELAEEYLRQIGVEVMNNTRITSFDNHTATTSSGQEIPFDIMELGIGFGAPKIYQRSGLATGPDGSLWVNDKLQSITAPQIFGGGDTIAFNGKPLTRVGIYAVRQGPYIYQNLLATVRNEPLQSFRPQQLLLIILNMGNEVGLLSWGNIAFRNKLAWKIKDMIDVKFIKTFQYPGISTDALIEYIQELGIEEEPPVVAEDDIVEDELLYVKS